MTTTQSYLTLDEQNFEREVLRSSEPVLVDFWADWCPPCKAIGPVIEQLAGEFEGVAKVGKVDVDRNPLLSEKYGISSIPALLFFEGGKVVDRVIGVVPKSTLTEMLSALLDGRAVSTP